MGGKRGTNDKMKKLFCALVLVALLTTALPAALAVNYPDKPDQDGYVLDETGTMGEQTLSDIKELNARTEEAFGGHIYVQARHFLGGMSVTEYAAGLFDKWGLGDSDALLVMIIGEEAYTLRYGADFSSTLRGETGDALVGTYFRTPYLSRRYDDALNAFLPELAKQMAKQEKTTVSTDGIFGKITASATSAPGNSTFDLSSFITSGNVDWLDYSDKSTDADVKAETEKSTGFSLRKIIIIIVILYFLFGRKSRKNKYNFRHPPRGR